MLIEYKNVNVDQIYQQVLHDVNLTIDAGELVYVTGKVGSGKSSLIKTLYAELPIYEGEAVVMDYDLRKIKSKHIPDLRRKIGVIFQDFQLLIDRTVEENLRFVLKATGWRNKTEMDRRIQQVLNLVGMDEKGDKYPNELSGGEQQRIAIARAILNNPQLILADEPTANLDEETSEQIIELLLDIRKTGSTIIIITHNMELLRMYPGREIQCVDQQVVEVQSNTVVSDSTSGMSSTIGMPNYSFSIG